MLISDKLHVRELVIAVYIKALEAGLEVVLAFEALFVFGEGEDIVIVAVPACEGFG
jgi:hypothetical protein